MSPYDLKGKVAIITGGSRGIGLAIAEALAAAGAGVVLTGRKQAGLDAAADQIRAQGGQALPLAAHSGDQEAINAAVATVSETWGGVDILVNNAGTNPHFGPVLTAEDSQWRKILEVNVLGYFHMAKACQPSMKARGGGKIINMSSVAGKEPQPGMGVYCVSKAAVLMLTEVLAVELAADNIQVNAIAPGFIKTNFSRMLWEDETVHQKLVQAIPQGRMAEAYEIAGTALYLASDASSFTTGTTIVVDGGQLVNTAVRY